MEAADWVALTMAIWDLVEFLNMTNSDWDG